LHLQPVVQLHRLSMSPERHLQGQSGPADKAFRLLPPATTSPRTHRTACRHHRHCQADRTLRPALDAPIVAAFAARACCAW